MAATRGQSEQVLPEPETLEGKTFSLLTGASVRTPAPHHTFAYVRHQPLKATSFRGARHAELQKSLMS